jgi:DNA repair protein RadC
LTQIIKEALRLVDVFVLDHFIIGDGDPLSLVEAGLM